MKEKVVKSICVVVMALAIIMAGVFLVLRIAGAREEKEAKIISAGFIGYDFARAVTDDKSEVAMLVKPGVETHNFEPTPDDIIKIKNADLFIYVGGESDSWVDKILKDNEISADHTLKLIDYVTLKEEEIVEGMEEEEEVDGAEIEYDEHIWTSPINAARLVAAIRNKMNVLRPEKAEVYTANADKYIKEIEGIHNEISEVVKNAARKELIFADRFPFRYLVDEYGLKYYAAFPGCSDQTEASSNTVAFLIDKVKTDDVKYVLKIELSSDQLAKMVADETGAEILVLNAAHNISQEDFDKGVTYADIMHENVKVLEKALK